VSTTHNNTNLTLQQLKDYAKNFTHNELTFNVTH
jgi:hypothetical protein